MKTFIPYSLLAAAAACGLAFGQTATTTPVGYITVPISGNASGNPAGASTFISASLTQPIEYAGKATASPSGGKVVALPTGVPTTFDGSYVLEITTAGNPQAGWWSVVTSSTATSITVEDNFPAGLPADVAVSVRKLDTLNSILGANNAAGLDGLDSESDTQFDFVNGLDPVTQVPTTYFYVTDAVVGAGNGGWFNFVTQAPAGNVPIYPGTAVNVVRNLAAATSLVITGTVKTTPTQVDIYPNTNWLGQPLAVGGSFSFMNFENQLVPFDNGTTPNDFLNVVSADTGSGQSATSYIALAPSIGGPGMFNFVTQAPSGDIVIKEGTGFLVQRDATQPASVITIPAQVVQP